MNAKSYDSSDPIYREFNGYCLALKEAMEGIGVFQRRIGPSDAEPMAPVLQPLKSSLAQAKRGLQEMVVPDALVEPLDIVIESSGRVLDALETILAALTANSQDMMTHMMRASRGLGGIQEKLYPLRTISSHLSRLFLEAGATTPEEPRDSQVSGKVPVGLNHVGSSDNDYTRGTFSFYVPESYTGDTPLPMVVALHGGSGHGRDFIWTWLREARSRRFILLSPTSVDRTWSLRNPAIDGNHLFSILDLMERHYNIDTDRILVTGMSDGGTFALGCCLQESTRFAAFAPIAGVLPSDDTSHVKGRRIYWAHGAWDQMFPLYLAQNGTEALENAGADITFRPIADLAHTYPREENGRILGWFDPGMSSPA